MLEEYWLQIQYSNDFSLNIHLKNSGLKDNLANVINQLNTNDSEIKDRVRHSLRKTIRIFYKELGL